MVLGAAEPIPMGRQFMLPDLAARAVLLVLASVAVGVVEVEAEWWWCLGATKAAAASLLGRVRLNTNNVNSIGAAESLDAEEWGDFIVSFALLCIRKRGSNEMII
jgi:hypothetical protein